MKTNHRRTFKANKPRRTAIGTIAKRLSDGSTVSVSFGGDACLGHRGEARQKRGAKKYLRVQERLLSKRLEKDPDFKRRGRS